MRTRFALAGAVLALCAAAPAAQAANVSCGDVITASIRIDTNLTNCPADGLVVGASNITIDLNYKTLDGIGQGAGISFPGGHHGVTIRRGTIRQFQQGVAVFDGQGHTVSNVVATGNTGDGFSGVLTPGLVLNSVKAYGNVHDGGSFGIFDGMDISSSTFSDNGNIGLRMSTMNGARVYASNVERNHIGLAVAQVSGFTVDFTDIRDNRRWGLEVWDAHDNRFSRLDATGNALQGMLFGGGSSSNDVVDNDASDNGTDGIEVRNGGNLIQDNEADDNGGWGIAAAAGNVDGGGNEASGNGQATQCTGVVCS